MKFEPLPSVSYRRNNMEKKQTNKNSTLTNTAAPEIIPLKPTHREPCTFKDVQDDIIRTTMAMKDTEHTAIVFSSCTLI
jgi:hypothetical protein